MAKDEKLSREDWQHLLQKDEGQLFTEFAWEQSSIEGVLRRGAPDEDEGRRYFWNFEPKIRASLCTEWQACKRLHQYQDQVALAMAVGDVLAGVFTGTPVATVSALVVKIGIKKICNCTEATPSI